MKKLKVSCFAGLCKNITRKNKITKLFVKINLKYFIYYPVFILSFVYYIVYIALFLIQACWLYIFCLLT